MLNSYTWNDLEDKALAQYRRSSKVEIGELQKHKQN